LPAPNSYIVGLRLAFSGAYVVLVLTPDGKIGSTMQRQANLPVTDYVCLMA